MRQVTPPRRDPAPSRWAYRCQRLFLTPGVRLFLRWGLPAIVVAAGLGGWLADPDHRAAVTAKAAEIRDGLKARPEFQVTLLAIEGASDETALRLRQTLSIDLPASSFDLDLESIRMNAEILDAVATAAVRIRSGGVLEVAVMERVPVAVRRSRKGLELVDASGHRVRTVAHRDARADLPLIAGDGSQRHVGEALDLMAAARPISDRVRGLLRVGERRWDVVLDRDQRILLPETHPVTALEKVILLDQTRDVLARDIRAVDLRDPERLTLRLSDSAVARLRGAQTTSGDDR